MREKQVLPGKINTDCLAERTRRTAEGCGQGILEGMRSDRPGETSDALSGSQQYL